VNRLNKIIHMIHVSNPKNYTSVHDTSEDVPKPLALVKIHKSKVDFSFHHSIVDFGTNGWNHDLKDLGKKPTNDSTKNQ